MFAPDDDVAINAKNREMILNAYDNSIVYTDHVIAETIRTLEGAQASTALFYCADHGEDLLDKCDSRFLHSSPTVTYYQLHVASLAWFSPEYRSLFPRKVAAARRNLSAPANTHCVFHTMADMASIRSEYVDESVSLLSEEFDAEARRFYLDDHNNAVPLDENIGIDAMQRDLFACHGILRP